MESKAQRQANRVRSRQRKIPSLSCLPPRRARGRGAPCRAGAGRGSADDDARAARLALPRHRRGPPLPGETVKKELVRQILWNRLIAVVEEQANVLLKTAFGPITREAGDLSAGVYDTKGRMLAQAVTGTPGHVNTMATAVAHFLDRFPTKSLKPGDVLVTNDPWMGTGHLFDFVTVTPAFLGKRHIGFFASTCHVIDIGGRGFVAEASSVYEEGIYFPHMKMMEAGKPNQTFFSVLTGNVREPMQVRGDLLGLVSCNEVATRRLAAMLEEFGLKDLDTLGEYIVSTSRASMLEAIRKLPQGTFPA